MTLIPSHHIALQDSLVSKTDLTGSFMRNDAAFMSGGFVFGGDNAVTMGDFLAKTEYLISQLFTWPLYDHPPKIIVLDVEKPVAPQGWGSQNAEYFAALKSRVQTVKAAFPNSEVGLYGTPFPPSGGNLKNYAAGEMAGYVNAMNCGVDFTCPVIRSPWVEADPSYSMLQSYVTLGIQQAIAIAPKLPVIPMLGFASVNGSSAGYQKQFTADVLRATLAIVYQFKQVSSVLFWAGDESQIGPTILSDVGFDKDDESERSIQHYWRAICYPRGM